MLAAPKTPGRKRENMIHNTRDIFIVESTFFEIVIASFEKLIRFSYINRLRSREDVTIG